MEKKCFDQIPWGNRIVAWVSEVMTSFLSCPPFLNTFFELQLENLSISNMLFEKQCFFTTFPWFVYQFLTVWSRWLFYATSNNQTAFLAVKIGNPIIIFRSIIQRLHLSAKTGTFLVNYFCHFRYLIILTYSSFPRFTLVICSARAHFSQKVACSFFRWIICVQEENEV